MVVINKPFQKALYSLKSNNIELLPHQKEALVWLLKREKTVTKEGKKKQGPFGGILADEMGLGKTLEIISIIIANAKKKTLVIVPANLIDQWFGEFNKFAPNIKVFVNNVEGNCPPESYVLLTSYIKGIRNAYVVEEFWDRIILDEGHFIRNSKGVVHKSILKLKADIKWILTGTPIQNYMSDLLSLLSFIGFKKSQLEEMETIVNKHILRRTKKGLNFNLPGIEVETVNVEHTSLYEKTFYRRLENNMFKKYSFHWLELILRLRQASILPQLVYDGYTKKQNKIKPIKWKYSNSKLNTIVKTIVSNPNEKPLIFCFFKKEIEYLKEKLELNDITYEVISGSVAMHERQRIIKSSDSYKVLILQMMAGSTGLNLQAFNSVHFTAPHWNPTHEQQAIARVYRIGQKNNVVIRKYVLKKTIEDTIVRIQNTKIRMIEEMIN